MGKIQRVLGYAVLAFFFFQSFAIAGDLGYSIPFDFVDNRIFVSVIINGKGPFSLILDTGGALSVDTQVAQELGLSLHDPFPVSGAGPDQVLGYLTELESLQVGEDSLVHQEAMVIPVGSIRDAIGLIHFDGVMGSEFFQKHVVQIDYKSSRLSVFPSSMNLESRGHVIPIVFDGSQPTIHATVDGVEGKFLVDTGDRFTLTLFGPFARKNGIREHYPQFITTCSGFGIGGPICGDILRLGSFGFWSSAASRIPVRIPRDDDYNVDEWAGSVGNGILKTHNLVVDYPHRQFIEMEESGLSSQDYDRSGLWLARSSMGFKVADVVLNGPAWKAGVRNGDLILEIDGNPVSALDLPDVRRWFSIAGEKKFKLTVRTKEIVKTVELKLQDLI
jgi:predicted aspartyl protease